MMKDNAPTSPNWMNSRTQATTRSRKEVGGVDWAEVLISALGTGVILSRGSVVAP